MQDRGENTASFIIRDATPADATAIAALHVQTFNQTHGVLPGGGPTLQLREYQWTEQFKQTGGNWFCFVIENSNGQLVGFAKGLPYQHNELKYDGELNKIYILRQYQRLGLGRRLVGHVARRFLQMGIHSMLLFGEASNPSNTFYELMGGEKLLAKNGEFHGGYGWKDLGKLAAICPAE